MGAGLNWKSPVKGESDELLPLNRKWDSEDTILLVRNVPPPEKVAKKNSLVSRLKVLNVGDAYKDTRSSPPARARRSGWRYAAIQCGYEISMHVDSDGNLWIYRKS